MPEVCTTQFKLAAINRHLSLGRTNFDDIYINGQNGAVGIGTGVPQARLHVNGDIRTSTGIVFGDSSGNVTSKSLDDYEEGTWTPTLTTDDGTLSVTYQATVGQKGTYTKIGKLVQVQGSILLDSSNQLGDSLRIEGLPYTSISNSECRGGGTVTVFTGFALGSNRAPSQLRVFPNSTRAQVESIVSSQTTAQVKGIDTTATSTIHFVLTYQAA